jgi:hypothetical protein
VKKQKRSAKEVPVMKTTMILSEPLWQAAKIRAVQERCDLKDLVAKALELYLRTVKKGGA